MTIDRPSGACHFIAALARASCYEEKLGADMVIRIPGA